MTPALAPQLKVPALPQLPDDAYDVIPHEAEGVFLGWTFTTRSRFPRRTRHHCVRPDKSMESLRCTSLTDAVNLLRGPAGLPALVDE